MTKSRIILMALIVVAAAVIVLLIAAPAPLKSLLGDEGYKQLWQLSLASIVGGLVSAAFSELKREQDSVDARREYLRAFHAGALAAYNRAKKCRRLLKAKAVFDIGAVRNVRQAEYDAQMLELQDVQLKFESMKRQAVLGGARFAGEPKLKDHLKTMQEFLRKVLAEFETFRFPAGIASVPLTELSCLQGLLDDRFVSGFADPYDDVEEALLRLLA